MAKRKGTYKVGGKVYRGDEEPEVTDVDFVPNRKADREAAEEAAARNAEHAKAQKRREHRRSQRELAAAGPTPMRKAYEETERIDAAKRRTPAGVAPLDMIIGRGRPVSDVDAYPQENVPTVTGVEPVMPFRNRSGHAGMGAGEARR